MTIQKFPIVILGAGFGGLQAAQSLLQSGKDVLLIHRRNYHTFVPLLYQVATQSFRYSNRGRLAIIGCHTGVGQIQGWNFTGFLGWIMWLGVHLVYLPGFRNRLFVLLTWLQTYVLGDRVARSILPLKSQRYHSTESVLKQKIRVGTATGIKFDP